MNNLFIKQEYRCPVCKKLIMKGLLMKCSIESKCPRCGAIDVFNGIPFLNSRERFLLVTNLNGDIVDGSVNIVEHTGHHIDNVVGKNISMFFTDEKDLESDKAFSRKLNKSPYLRLDTNYLDSKGIAIPVSVWFKKFEKEGVTYIFRAVGKYVRPVASDKVEIILKNIGKDLPSVFNQEDSICISNDGCDFLAEFDFDANIIYVSSKTAEAHGFRQEEVIGKSILDFLVPKEHVWDIPRLIVRCVRREIFKTVAYTKCKDGNVITTDAVASPFYDDTGNYLGYRLMGWKR